MFPAALAMPLPGPTHAPIPHTYTVLGTLHILLPALVKLAKAHPFLLLFICDSSPLSNPSLPQMKSLHTVLLNPHFPGHQRKLLPLHSLPQAY